MNITYAQFIYLVCFFQIVIFSMFLIRNRNIRKSNTFLGLFFLSQFVIISAFTLNLFYGQKSSVFLFYLRYPVYWMVPPSLLFFIKYSLFPLYQFKKKDILHLMPFLVMLLFCSVLIFNLIIDSFERHAFLSLNVSKNIWLALSFAMYAYFLLYSIIELQFIKRNEKRICETTNTHFEEIRWLKIVTWGFLFTWIINALFTYTIYYKWFPQIQSLLEVLTILPFLVYFNIFFFKAWSNPLLFNYNDVKISARFIKINPEKTEQYLENLLNFMDREKPYLDPEISINKLAEMLQIPIKHLSQLINTKLEQNFYDFINKYRTEEVIEVLKKSNKLDIDLVSLGLDCGFNSKATFFRVFKKITNQTPLQFFESIHFRHSKMLEAAC